MKRVHYRPNDWLRSNWRFNPGNFPKNVTLVEMVDVVAGTTRWHVGENVCTTEDLQKIEDFELLIH